MTTRRPFAALLVAAALLPGCAVGRAMTASNADYLAYRRYRVAPTFDERLGAAWDYLQERPDGTYAGPLRTWFDGAEPVFYAVRRRSMAGLESYLQALPAGPHADAALDELMQRRFKARRDEVRLAAAERTSQRLDQEHQQRQAVAELPLHWSEMLMDPAAWSVPFDRVPRELILAYSLELPHAECLRDEDAKIFRCSKHIDLGFPVVEQGEVQDRRLMMWVELELDSGWQLHAARLFGPELFVHTVEARDKHIVAADDRAARDAALEGFEDQLLDRLRRPGNGCDVALGEDWSLRCPGRRLVVHRGSGDEDDTITIEPAR